jgi:hypothetical protein
MSPPVVILLAFANDWVDDKRHLRSLLEESKAIDKALAPLVETGAIVLPAPIHNATVDDVIGAFRDRRYRDRIRIFHFAGHASGSMLLFEDQAGRPSSAHAAGLAGYLGKQRGLMLVFLNGCSTGPQVRRLREAGVHAVVATTSTIQDAVAAEFAAAFYAELATRSLREAYETAVQAVRLRSGDDPRAVTRESRDAVPVDGGEAPQWPWIFDCDPACERWTLASELARQSHRTWRRRGLLAAAATLVLWMTALAVSADARRAWCRVPGLRSLCTAVGTGGVPTPAEDALWAEARTQRSGDGLRAYLSRYPTGAYAEEGRARLAGCVRVPVETPGPTDERRYAQWRVNPGPTRAFSTEDQARGDALRRGNDDAHEVCAALGVTDSLLSASVEPRTWECAEHEQGWACGFWGDLVCRLQRRVLTSEERCDEASVRAAMPPTTSTAKSR